MTADAESLADHIREQIDFVALDRRRPLIVTDADEVLLRLVVGLETYLETRGLWLHLQSFALTGNIKYRDSDEPVASADVPAILEDFFATATGTLSAVPGAAAALQRLSQRAQIVVLTNVPPAHKEDRKKSLAGHGMDYPVVVNKGPKGPAMRALAHKVDAPAFFLDDLPQNIASVAKAHAPVWRLHFIADERLARLTNPADDSHIHTTSWPDAVAFIEDRLAEAGF